MHQNGEDCAYQPQQEESPPAFYPKMILPFNYKGMEQPNNKKCTESYKEPFKV